MRAACAIGLLLFAAGMAPGQERACYDFQRERSESFSRESWSFRSQPERLAPYGSLPFQFQSQPSFRFQPQPQPSFRFEFERRRGLLRRERLRLEFGSPYESPTFRFRGG